MPKDTYKGQMSKGPNPQGSDNPKPKKNGILLGVFAFLTAIMIIAIVIGGAFFMVIHNNVNGLGERYRKDLQVIPLLKLALPPVSDPEDPKYLTDAEIKIKYQQLRILRDELSKKLDDSNKKIAELQKFKDNEDTIAAENEKIKKDMADQKIQLDTQQKQTTEEKKKVDEMIASGDKAGFKDYFEKIDKETAVQIYSDIIKQQKINQDIMKLVQIYEAMDPSSAAKVLEQMGTSKMDTIITILKNMKKENVAGIIAAMTTEFASNVTDKLLKAYLTPK